MNKSLIKLMILIIIGEVSELLIKSSAQEVQPRQDDSRTSNDTSQMGNLSTIYQSRSSTSFFGAENSNNDSSLTFLTPKVENIEHQSTILANVHSNHQANYPNEPYPSASYTSIVSSLPQQSHAANHRLLPSNHQSPLIPLLTRDYHQSSSIGQPQHQSLNDYSDYSSNNFSNSFGNQYNPNHNYDSVVSTSSLNTGLIQNLTSSLFPIKQLNNATLSSLSDLLNKTKQHYSSQPYTSAAGYKPSLNYGYYSTNNYYVPGRLSSAASSPLLSSSTNSNNYFDHTTTSLADHLLDYIKPNQFGFREIPTSRYQQTTNLQRQPITSVIQSPNHKSTSFSNFQFGNNQNLLYSNSHQYHNNDNAAYRTSSNNYNTYVPSKDALNPLPTVTNGQTLAMAIYDNLLDNGYRIPSNSYKSFPQSSKLSSVQSGDMLNGFGRLASSGSLSPDYQYIQHYNMNNQNHLDKIIYHSTPFRPSIVSPPQTSGANTLTNNLPASTNNSSQQLNSNQRLKSDADTKPISFATLSSSSSTVSDTRPDYLTNGQVINANRYTPSARNVNKSEEKVIIDESGETSARNSTTGKQSESVNSLAKNSSIPAPSSLSAAPALLFDLYEREIDNQIREALYGDAAQHSDQIIASALSSANARPQQTLNWPTSLYPDDSNEQALASWTQTVASSSAPYLSASPTKLQPTVGQMPTLQSALQELPTFSASDLQPIFPAGPSYSLVSPSTTQESFLSAAAAEPSISLLASQLLPLMQSSVNSNNPSSSTKAIGSQASSSPTTSSSSYLPTILFKLHSSPLSSILANPLTHLYSRNKDKKKPASTQQTSHFVAPSSGLKADSQQAALASLIANAAVAAASDNQLSPIQSAFLQANALQPELDFSGSTLRYQNQLALSHPASSNNQTPTGYGLAGGGISPLVWRNILSPALWTRIQSTSVSLTPSTSSGQSTNQFQQLGSKLSTTPSKFPLQYGSHFKSNQLQSTNEGRSANAKQQLPLGYLFNNPLVNAPSTTSPSALTGIQKKPKLKIKILKIPVAFYDQPFAASGGEAQSSRLSLLPAQMQPSSLAASLLTTIPCPLQHNGAQSSHTLEQHLVEQQTMGALMSPTLSSAAPQSSTSIESPVSMQGFTDINQPNDLQVSPSDQVQGRLFKMVR